jgi:hypothetical protein
MNFNFFSKNKRIKLPKETFAFFQLTKGGKQYLLRFNTALKDKVIQKRYPFQVGIAVPLINTLNGFPTKEESKILQDIEENFIKKIDLENNGIFAGAITGGDMKEFVFYTNTPEKVKSVFEEIQVDVKEFKFQLIIQKDEGWKIYKAYCPTK